MYLLRSRHDVLGKGVLSDEIHNDSVCVCVCVCVTQPRVASDALAGVLLQGCCTICRPWSSHFSRFSWQQVCSVCLGGFVRACGSFSLSRSLARSLSLSFPPSLPPSLSLSLTLSLHFFMHSSLGASACTHLMRMRRSARALPGAHRESAAGVTAKSPDGEFECGLECAEDKATGDAFECPPVADMKYDMAYDAAPVGVLRAFARSSRWSDGMYDTAAWICVGITRRRACGLKARPRYRTMLVDR